MKRHTLVIADSSQEIQKALQSQLNTFCQVFCCSTGTEALELLKAQNPDVLVLDLMLPQLDGLSLLELLSAAGDRPGILAESAYVSPYVLEKAQSLGVSVLMEKPFDLKRMGRQIRELLRARDVCSREDRFIRVSGILLRLGFSAKLRGYSYLREAVLRYSLDPGQSILKELYPKVAVLYGVTAEDVEHSIRSAAMDAWAHRNGELWELYFSDTRENQNQRPSNAALIQILSGSLGEDPQALKAKAL